MPDLWNGGGWFRAFGEYVARNGYHVGEGEAKYPDYHGSAVYRRWIDDSLTPEKGEKVRIVLHFEAVAAGCCVFVNGREVGSHLGAFDPFEMEVTSAWNHGGRNLIALRVDDLLMFRDGSSEFVRSRYAVGHGEYNSGMGGIWQSVWIEKRPVSGFDAVLVDTTQNDLHLRLKRSEKNQGGAFRVTLRDGERIVHQECFTDDFFSRTIRSAESWSPDYPKLYTLLLEWIDADGSVRDRVEKTIGFRRLEIVGKELRLNGKPFFLRGASFPPAALIPEDTHYIERYLGILKEHNIQILHGSKEPLPAAWLEACDRIGMCVIQMSSFSWKTPPLPQAKAEVSSIVQNSLNHPCVIMYCLGHESSYPCYWNNSPNSRTLSFQEYFRELAEVVRSYGCESPIIRDMAFPAAHCGGEMDTWTNFWGWYYHTAYNFSRCLEKLSPQEQVYPKAVFHDQTFNDRLKRGIQIGGDKPLFFSEPIGAYSDPEDGHLLQTPFRMRRIGRNPSTNGNRAKWLADNLEYAADLADKCTQAVRRLRHDYPYVSGQLSFMASNWMFHPLDTNRMSPKPILKAIGHAYSPVLVSLETWQEHFYGGRMHSLSLQVIHDDSQTPVLRGDLHVRLVNSRGVMEAEADFPKGSSVSVELGRNVQVPFCLSIPSSDIGRYRLVLKFQCGQTEYVSEREIFLGSNEWVSRPVSSWGKFELLDPLGVSSEKFHTAGAPFRRIGLQEALRESRVPLVVGAYCLDHLNDEICNSLRQQVFYGRKVLVLEQNAPVQGVVGVGRNESFRRKLSFLPNSTLTLTREFTFGCSDRNSFDYDDIVHLCLPEHPVFHGLAPMLMRRWGRDTVLISSYLQSTDLVFPEDYREDGYMNMYRTRYPENVTPLAECFMYCRDSAVAEITYGDGMFLLSQIEAHRHFDDDPVAARYLFNLIRYISNVVPILAEDDSCAIGLQK